MINPAYVPDAEKPDTAPEPNTPLARDKDGDPTGGVAQEGGRPKAKPIVGTTPAERAGEPESVYDEFRDEFRDGRDMG